MISKISVDECYAKEEEDAYLPMIHLNILPREVEMHTSHEVLKLNVVGLKGVDAFKLIPKSVSSTPVSGMKVYHTTSWHN